MTTDNEVQQEELEQNTQSPVDSTEPESSESTEKGKRGRKPKDVEKSEKQEEKSPISVNTIGPEIRSFGLGLFALNEYVELPKYATEYSACFDIKVNLKGIYNEGITKVKVINKQNQQIERKIEVDGDGRLFVDLRPLERMFAPTGIILDIPPGYSVKVHPRSGTAIKQGINLINQEGIIDADYVEELLLPIVNSSDNYVKIYDGERYVQAELQQVVQTNIVTLKERPQQKTSRTGGFGHTGVN